MLWRETFRECTVADSRFPFGEKIRMPMGDGPFDVTVAGGALARAAYYRREATKYRQMAESEANGDIQNSLRDLAQEYDALAASLAPNG